MATKAKKASAKSTPRKTAKATQAKAGAGPATAARSKDAKKTFGKAAPKTVKPAATAKTSAKPSKATSAGKPSIAKRAIRKVAKTATGAMTGAVAMAASVVGKGDRTTKSKAK